MRSIVGKSWKCFLIFCIFAGKQTLLDTSSEFDQLSFAPGVTMEGQFLASLAPSSSRLGCVCPQTVKQDDAHILRAAQQPMLQLLNVNQAQKDAEDPFWQVMLHDDTEHTLEYAIEALERSLLSIKSAENDKENLEESENPTASVMRTRRRLQWTAFQTHHYGMGIVSVLPRHDAESLVSQLSREGLRSSMVPF